MGNASNHKVVLICFMTIFLVAAFICGCSNSKIETLWDESDYINHAFSIIIERLKTGDYIAKGDPENAEIFLKDPDNKPFYNDDPSFDEPVYGKVITYYEELVTNLWPLAQEYKTLGFINVYVIGAYAYYPQNAEVFKVKAEGKVSAQAKIVKVIEYEDQTFAGLEVEEVHFDSGGKPIFRCISVFNADLIKISEKDIVGEKQEEYFFIWPRLIESD